MYKHITKKVADMEVEKTEAFFNFLNEEALKYVIDCDYITVYKKQLALKVLNKKYFN